MNTTLKHWCGAAALLLAALTATHAAAAPVVVGSVNPATRHVTIFQDLLVSSFPDGTYGGLAVGYLLEAEGKTIYHSGDTAAFAEMAWIGEERSIDAAFLPIGDNYTMGPREALRAVKMLRPALVVPIHYNTFPAIETEPVAFARLVAAAGFEARVMEAGETLEL